MFKNPSFLFDIVCTVVWLLLAVRYARKGFLASSVQLGGNVFSLVGARVFSGWAAAEVFQRFLAGSFRTQMREHGLVTIIDDAYNSNPVGSRAAVETLAMFDGIRILITPGMVELGDKEAEYNHKFGNYAADCCDYIQIGRASCRERV